MNEHSKDDVVDSALSERAKSLFDESVAGLDGETQSKLNRGRHAALAAASRRPAWQRYAPATGVAAAAIVAALIVNQPNGVVEIENTESVTDLEILLDEDSLEMLEDLEFYSWMELAEGEPEETAMLENHVG